MTTKRSKPRQTPLEEATDPTTDPKRLEELSRHRTLGVQRAVWRHPSVPEDSWRKALLKGEPEAWANPMVLIYMLTWTPRQGETSLEKASQLATGTLRRERKRCSPEGKALLAVKIQEWWATSESGQDMMGFLASWVMNKDGSSEYRKVVRILVLCVRTAPDLTVRDRQALDFIEDWSVGGQDRRKEAEALASSRAVIKAVWVALFHIPSPGVSIFDLLQAIASDKEGTEFQEAVAKHDRLLADVIRGAMPLPPVVE